VLFYGQCMGVVHWGNKMLVPLGSLWGTRLCSRHIEIDCRDQLIPTGMIDVGISGTRLVKQAVWIVSS